MSRAHLEIIVVSLVCFLWGATSVQAEPPRVALVIANSQYSNLPTLARCAASAGVARDALRAEGYEIIDRRDLGRGEFDSAIGQLARLTASGTSTVAGLYYCGYGVAFKERPFLLPTSATLAREHDVLTQGILVKSIIASLRRAPDGAGFVMLDVFAPPGTPPGGMVRVIEHVPASSFAVVAAGNDGPGQGPTTAALALRDQLGVDALVLGRLVDALRGRLAGDAAITAHVVAATDSAAAAIIGRRPPPAEASTAKGPSGGTLATLPPLPAARPDSSFDGAPGGSAPRLAMPGENDMSEQDRRRVQAVLAAMGYYAGSIDGVFGPETRAAIRRYQFEIKAERTGRLTAEQATRLVGGSLTSDGRM
ncbi:MAG: peptidoglycan-binding protein [Reyranella sp.]|uniref:peptidoglycan-binding protein n=1 Tax=Reyranella sp. TaxID=1929291 RepID=UPI003D0EF073